MTTQGHDHTKHPFLSRAMHAETLHLLTVEHPEPDETRDPGELLQELLDEAACSIGCAMLGAATRHRHEYAHDEEIQKLVREAERVVGCLPPRLHPLWRAHYLEGHPLAVYAARAGLDAAAAQADYLEILRELVPIVGARPRESVPASGPRRVDACVAHDASA